MKTRLKAWLLRRLLDLHEPTDVAVVSIIEHEAVITHGTLVPRMQWAQTAAPTTYRSGWIH